MIRIKMLVGAVVALALLPGTALADKIGPGPNPNITETINPASPLHVHPGPPTVVSVGDSAISGEAGRWAGNTNGLFVSTDALGPLAYNDNATGTAETIPGCHRSKSAEVRIGGGVTSVNLACSGAKTSTYVDGNGRVQARARLQEHPRGWGGPGPHAAGLRRRASELDQGGGGADRLE